MIVWLAGAEFSAGADLVTVQAESGTLGANFSIGNDGATQFITISPTGAGNAPSNSARVATYNVIFPAAGTYDLYARVRVGAGGPNDDSFFYGNGFGNKSVTTIADWILVNNISNVGYTNSSSVVAGTGTVGTGVWKWINLSEYTGSGTPITFTVTAGNLTQTFQIGGREDGLDLDKVAFGSSGTSFAVSDLGSGIPPAPPTNAFFGPDGIAFHRFGPLDNGVNVDGANPAAGLVWSGGILCGTTVNGGLQGAGTAFYMSPDGTNFVAFRSFAGAPDAGNPMSDLGVSANGFFGTSFSGGASSVGTVFSVQTNGNVSVLRSFSSVYPHTATNSGGASPTARIASSGNTLYGTTTSGGTTANGTIFSLTTNGSTFLVLHDFTLLDSQAGTNADGAAPMGGLILSGDTLYGTASAGGAGGNGVVFKVRTNGGNFTVLHSFTPMDTLTATNTDGAIPFGGLALAGDTLYGTTTVGGTGGRGTIFSVGTNGLSFSVVHHFSATDAVAATNADGAAPCAPPTVVGSVLYGTASSGGAGANGTVYSVSTDGTQFTTLYNFTATDSTSGTNRDGALPLAGLVRVGNSLYGTTFSGGPGAVGTVFRLSIANPPAVITNAIRNVNGSVTLFFLGGPNSTNIVQATASLTPPVIWQNVSTNVADAAGAWQFTESNATNSTRFYRSYAP